MQSGCPLQYARRMARCCLWQHLCLENQRRGYLAFREHPPCALHRVIHYARDWTIRFRPGLGKTRWTEISSMKTKKIVSTGELATAQASNVRGFRIIRWRLIDNRVGSFIPSSGCLSAPGLLDGWKLTRLSSLALTVTQGVTLNTTPQPLLSSQLGSLPPIEVVP